MSAGDGNLEFQLETYITVVRRIERRMTVNHIKVRRYYEKCPERNPREFSSLNREFLIGVTSFSSDKAAFDFLAESNKRVDQEVATFPKLT
jgi:two-component system, chemotaxis family, CheB/CheR fusion protein